MKKSLILLFLLVPSTASAEALLPAICEQVISPQPQTSVAQIVTNHIVEKLKTAPQDLAQDAKQLVDGVAQSLAESVESRKSSLAAGVLGASDVYKPTLWQSIYDKLLSTLAFIIRHWIWALGAITIFIVGYSFRP